MIHNKNDSNNEHKWNQRISVYVDRAREQLQRPKRSVFQRIARMLTHRLVISGVMIIGQIALLLGMVMLGSKYFIEFSFLCNLLSLAAVLYLISKTGHPDYKIAWIVPIMAFPLFGGLLYLLFGGNWATKSSMKRMKQLEEIRSDALETREELAAPLLSQLDETNQEAAVQSRYIFRACCCPPHANTETVYLPTGEDYFQCMMEELEKAEKYIFIQYFIIKEGVMWNSILDILKRKAAEGVDVRVIYDDVGCMFTLPVHYAQELKGYGIRCAVFNPFVPIVSLRLNNRDHRKICVIDGHTGFTGGLNLSDEYINEWERFGHWKDTGIMLRGEGVWNLTAIFLSCWVYASHEEEQDYEQYRPHVHFKGAFSSDGMVQPYTSNPGEDSVGLSVYMHLINRAKKYLYITTPYLVIDDAVKDALCDAARSGVDVRIITPHIPDKQYVFELTRAHYIPLLEAGVKIFEYTPGFIHAKTFAVDDEYGVVGTVNMDYRSLFLHYECGVWLYQSSAVLDIRRDFEETQNRSQPVELHQVTRMSGLTQLYRAVLRVFAPLM